jgi:putative SOS response-associated peptidase YedK
LARAFRFPYNGGQRNRDAPIHPKAMPVILTTPEEVDLWMTAPAKDALTLQRPLPDDALRIVARGQKQDGLPDDQPFISA